MRPPFCTLFISYLVAGLKEYISLQKYRTLADITLNLWSEMKRYFICQKVVKMTIILLNT